jgi:transcription antitermination factor NusG
MIQVRRRDRVVKTMWHTVAIPAFGRYLFVRGPIRWGTLKEIPGICDVLKNGLEVAYTPDAVVERLRALKELPAPQSGWTPGAPCTLVAGPFGGHPAVILSVRRDKADLAVMIMGALRNVRVSLDALAPREAPDDHPNPNRSSDAARIR